MLWSRNGRQIPQPPRPNPRTSQQWLQASRSMKPPMLLPAAKGQRKERPESRSRRRRRPGSRWTPQIPILALIMFDSVVVG
jgi:hypothetical protein